MKKFEDLMSVKNEIENISASEAKDKLNDPNVQFIDVRDKESFSKGTIGNAIHLDKAFLEFLSANNIDYEIIEKGSSLKLCSLADGEADIYPRFGPTSEWDIAAAQAVLSSYGGNVIKIEDYNELDYAKQTSILNPYFIAFRNNSIKDDFLPLLGDFFKKLV